MGRNKKVIPFLAIDKNGNEVPHGHCTYLDHDVPMTEFAHAGKGKLKTYCKACDVKRRAAYVNSSIERFITNLRRSRKQNAGKDIPFTITANELIELWYAQGGLCFYTGKPMRWVHGEGVSDDALSLDKIIPELGYVTGNVVLCTVLANNVKANAGLAFLKEWIPKWYEKIVTFFKARNIEYEEYEK